MKEETKSTVQKIVEAIAEKRQLFFAGLFAVVAGSVALIGWQVAEQSLDKKAQLIAEELETAYQEAMEAKESAETRPVAYSNRKIELQRLLDRYSDSYPSRYSGYRVAFIQAEMAEEEEDFETAAQLLEECGKTNRHPLAPMMILESAVHYENLGDSDKALSLLEWVVSNKKGHFVYPRAVFNVGRLLEVAGNFEEAEEFYHLIADEAGEEGAGDYAALAKSRLISLETADLEGNAEDAE